MGGGGGGGWGFQLNVTMTLFWKIVWRPPLRPLAKRILHLIQLLINTRGPHFQMPFHLKS